MSVRPPSSGPREREVFLGALECPAPAERAAFLERACAEDRRLRERVEALLAKHDRLGRFLEDPAAGRPGPTGLLPGSAPEAVVEVGEGPGDRIGPYRLLERLGEGGWGVVYVADQERPVRRRVALKVIKVGMDTRQVIARFEAERQALALMDHPNIARFLDAGVTGAERTGSPISNLKSEIPEGRPYFVMELVRGVRITDYCEQNDLSVRERLELFLPVCRAVQHAHQKGIIHRDLKPSNVLVTVNDGRGVPKVIDFGIAKAFAGERLTDKTLYTAFEQFMGTPAYMSPEQATLTSLDIDTRTDIYSLGVLLYELLTGATPFDGRALLASGLDELRRTIREKDPVRPSTRLRQSRLAAASRRTSHAPRSTVPASLPSDLDWIVMKCLEKDRARRYETVNGLAVDVQRHLNHEAVVARPPRLGYVLAKFIRRHRVTAAAAAAVVCVGALGLAGTLWQLHQAQRNAAATRRQLIESHVATGNRLAEADDLLAALPWYVRALELESDPMATARHRSRFGTALALAPRLVQLWGHDAEVNAVRFSPDGRAVASASADRTARVWSLETGEPLTPPLTDSQAMLEVVFSPDGGRLLTRSGRPAAEGVGGTSPGEGAIAVWELPGGRLWQRIPHTGYVSAAVFSADGQSLLTGDHSGAATWYDARTGEPKRRLPHPAPVLAAVLSPDGRLALTSADDSRVRLWDLERGTVRDETPGSGAIRHVAFSPDGRWFAALSGHGAWVKRTDTCEPVGSYFEGGAPGGAALEFSPDGDTLLLGYANLKVRICDVATSAKLVALNDETRVSYVRQHFGARFSPDGSAVLTWGEDGAARIWGTLKGWRIYPPLHHAGAVSCAQFAPDGRRVVTAGTDGLVKVWDLASPASLNPKRFHSPNGSNAAWAPDGHSIVSQNSEGGLVAWDPASGDPLPTPELTHAPGPHPGAVPRWSRDGRRLLTVGRDGTCRVWDGRTFARLSEVGADAQGGVVAADLSPDGATVAAAVGEALVRRFRASDGAEEAAPPMRQAESVRAIEYTPNGRWIVVQGLTTARVWDAASGQAVSPVLPHGATIQVVAIHPQAQCLATGGSDGRVRRWSLPVGAPLGPELDHHGSVLALTFSPDGARLLSGNEEGTACVWECDSGARLHTLPHGVAVTAAWFDHEGRRIGTASQLAARLWDAATGEALSPWLKLYQFRSGAWEVLPSPVDDRWLTISGGFAATVWQPAADLRPVEELRVHARLVSGTEPGGAAGALDGWRRLRAVPSPVLEVSAEEALGWHRNMAEYAEVNRKPFTVSFHLRPWLAARPEDPWARRGAALAALAQGRPAEARSWVPDILPARPIEATAAQLDLTEFYQWRLDAFGDVGDSAFQEFHPGCQRLGDVRFDARGVIELGGLARLHQVGPMPRRIAGLPAVGRVRRLHMLQAAASEATDGTLIGRYVLRYADGEARELPIRYGEDVRNHLEGGGHDGNLEARVARVVWTGHSRKTTNRGGRVRLYSRTYENPRPEADLVCVDFESTLSQCSPLLLAITLEH